MYLSSLCRPFSPLSLRSFVDRILVYALDISDDDLDPDFSPLVSSDCIEKYEFDAFALVERNDPKLNEPLNKEVPPVLVTLHLAQGVSIYRFPANAQLSTVLERAMVRRDLRQLEGYEYHLESWVPVGDDADSYDSEQRPGSIAPGQKLELSLRLSDVIAAGLPLQFALIRDNSRCLPVGGEFLNEEEVADSGGLERLHSALQLRQYRVSLLKGLFQREVQLNVSAEGVKIEQVNPSRRPKLFPKLMKPLVLGIHTLADCELVSSMSSSASRLNVSDGKTGNLSSTDVKKEPSAPTCCSGKVQFRIVYLDSGITSSDNVQSVKTNACSSELHLDMTANDGIPKLESNLSFQQLCFETQWARARTICDQITLVLECSRSKSRQLYMQRRLAS